MIEQSQGGSVWSSTRFYFWSSSLQHSYVRHFLIVEEYDIASYTDNNTPYSASETIENVMLNFEKLLKNLFHWFYLNQMKSDPNKCHLLLSTSEKVTLNVQDLSMINSESGKLLGITIGSNFSF